MARKSDEKHSLLSFLSLEGASLSLYPYIPCYAVYLHLRLFRDGINACRGFRVGEVETDSVLILHNLLTYRKGQRRHIVNATHHKHNIREYL